MQTITLKLELQKPTKDKMAMYRKMTEINTSFANWLLNFEGLKTATSKVFRLFSEDKFPSAVANQTIRIVKSKNWNINNNRFSYIAV